MGKTNPTLRPLILTEHIEAGYSLRAIERRHGLANGCLSNYARNHNIPVRSKSAQATLDFATGRVERQAGSKHWSWGLTKKTSRVMAAHSARMTANNPSRMPGVVERAKETKIANGTYAKTSARMSGLTVSYAMRQKIAKTVAPQLLQRMSKREQMVQSALIADGRWIAQYQTGCAILDFAIPELLVAIEIDCGGGKFDRALERDLRLVGDGWTIFRCRNELAKTADYYSHLFRVAEQLIPDFKCPDKLPDLTGRQYRVVIRCPEYPAGLSVNSPDDPALARLRADRQNATPRT